MDLIQRQERQNHMIPNLTTCQKVTQKYQTLGIVVQNMIWFVVLADAKKARKAKKSSQEKEQGKKASRRRSTDGNPLDVFAKPKRAPREPSDAKAQDADAPKKARRKKSEATDPSRRRKNRSCGDVMVDYASDSGQKLGSQLSEDDDDQRQSRRNW